MPPLASGTYPEGSIADSCAMVLVAPEWNLFISTISTPEWQFVEGAIHASQTDHVYSEAGFSVRNGFGLSSGAEPNLERFVKLGDQL